MTCLVKACMWKQWHFWFKIYEAKHCVNVRLDMEEFHNPDFNRVQFEAVRSEAGLNRFVMTPTKWIEQTNAIGIVSKAGKWMAILWMHKRKKETSNPLRQ